MLVFRLNALVNLVSTPNTNTVTMLEQMQERVKSDRYSVQRVKLLVVKV